MSDMKSVSAEDIERVANEYLSDEKAWRAVMRKKPSASLISATHADVEP